MLGYASQVLSGRRDRRTHDASYYGTSDVNPKVVICLGSKSNQPRRRNVNLGIQKW